jgi:hypothetical protein
MWLALRHKILTWDNFQKRGYNGSNMCNACMDNDNFINHLLEFYPFTIQVWKDLEMHIGLREIWSGASIDEGL